MPDLPTSKAGIEALPLPERNAVDYRDTKQRALWLRVSPAGTKSWCIRYKRAGKSQRENIGRFPELPISLAREAAAKVLGSIASGVDPVAERKAARQADERRSLETVEAIAARYLEEAAAGRHRMNGKPMRPKSLKLESDYLNGVVVPKLGRRRLADLTRIEIQTFVNGVEKDRSPGAARHSRNALQKVFAFAVWQDVVTTDPTRFVSAPGWTERERVLTDAEMQALWQGLDALPSNEKVSVSPSLVLAIKLAAVTLQRRGEVTGMRVNEIDRAARTWTMPGERTKNGRLHIVPLSDLALSLIDQAIRLRSGQARECAFVFPSPRSPERPIEPNAMTHAWGRILPHLTVPAPTAKDPKRRKPLAGITVHDLRRTGATAITSERIEMSRFVVSQILNHTSDSGGTAAVTSVYDRNAYMKEKRAALSSWADLLQSIVAVEDPA